MALGDFGRATCGAERKKVASRGKSWHVASHPATHIVVRWKLSTTLSTFQKYILYSTYSTHLSTQSAPSQSFKARVGPVGLGLDSLSRWRLGYRAHKAIAELLEDQLPQAPGASNVPIPSSRGPVGVPS